jgi:glutamate dehydrogenase/leucine dehydrogenase
MNGAPIMSILSQMETAGHEQVIFHYDAASGLRAIVAIHSTALGPALGGARWQPYASEEDALFDVLRLSIGMTEKSAVAGLDVGGGKAVVIGDPAHKSAAQLEAFGRFIDSLGGRYITTTDVGTTTAEMDVIAGITPHVVGTSAGMGGSGDTSVLTAVTVMHGMRAALQVAFGDESLQDRRVVVVGTGKVGARVAQQAVEAGAQVAVADVRGDASEALARAIGAEVLDPLTAYQEECDVLSPNALGAIFTAESIPTLRCRVICGAANNQLLNDPADAMLLMERGIIYAPDYVVNCGGVISAAVQVSGISEAQTETLAARVYDTTLAVLRQANEQGITSAEAAAMLVRQRLAG